MMCKYFVQTFRNTNFLSKTIDFDIILQYNSIDHSKGVYVMKINIRQLMRSVLIIMILMVYLSSSALAASYACKINTRTKVYQRASTSSASITVPKNMKCTMTGLSGSWARVKNGKTTAYIPVKYLTLTNRITAYAASSTPMYKKASSSSSKMGTLSKGTKVYINGRDGSFFRCQNSSGSITGYVKISALSPNKPKVSSSSSSSSGSSSSSNSSSSSSSSTSVPTYSSGMSNSQKIDFIVKLAESLKGKPYSSSANPPKSFDCSRFVKYCFGQAKISLSGSAKDQGYSSKYDRITSTGSLKKGDVVVFNTNSTDSDLSDHTGIYIGSGYFIHASSSAGKVIVSSLSSGYYKRTFSWGLRIIG